ncbi:MAG: lipid-A-disaccharide synthase [Candidatus Omnitrophica bacterium]|nr:lipid-A-disaccharide synthase [Candidatus Omnitrophota bacterium]
MGKKQFFIICGEASGDLHAATLVNAIRAQDPQVTFLAVGGSRLREAGATLIADIKDFSVIGFFDVLAKLPLFFRLKKLVLQKIKEEKPSLLILVDFSGFNLRLAKELRKTVPTIYYISPQVWASRQGRIETIRRYIHKMLVFFRFEEEFYESHGIKVECVGHPLLDIVKPSMEKKEFLATYGLSDAKTTIALLPGSRHTEIQHNLPVMLQSARRIYQYKRDVQFVIAKTPQMSFDIYNTIIGGPNINITIVDAKTYDCVSAADFCLVASGTATLETAILGTPFCIIYKIGALNYLLYRPQVRVPHIGIVNIIAGKEIVPEFIQSQATPRKISDFVLKTLQTPPEMQRIKESLTQVTSDLGEPGAAGRAATIILDTLKATLKTSP